MKYRIIYDYCDEYGYVYEDCVEDFDGSYTELQDYIKEMKRNDCYNINATALEQD